MSYPLSLRYHACDTALNILSFKHRFVVVLLPVVASLIISACISIPLESVDLSKHVGAGIGKSRAAHLSTLDAFYRKLQDDNDAWVLETFLPRAIDNSAAYLAAECKEASDESASCSQLGQDDYKRVVKNTIAFRDELQRALEKHRDDAFRVINDHYADLIGANAGVTGLLASAVDVNQATRDASKTLGDITGIEIDTNAIERAVDEYLEKAGATGEKVSDLEKRLSEILEKLKKEIAGT